jgi:hypothetical protein
MTETQVFGPKRFASLKRNAEVKCFVEAKRFHLLLPEKRKLGPIMKKRTRPAL